jgi:hypothetical protein
MAFLAEDRRQGSSAGVVGSRRRKHVFQLPLRTVLAVAASLIACDGTLEYFVLGQFLPAPFIVAALLAALCMATRRWARGVALVCLGLSVLIPVGALLGYLRGELNVAVPIFDTVIFAWVFANALRTTRHGAA